MIPNVDAHLCHLILGITAAVCQIFLTARLYKLCVDPLSDLLPQRGGD